MELSRDWMITKMLMWATEVGDAINNNGNNGDLYNCENALQAMSLISSSEECLGFVQTVLGRFCWRLVLVLALKL